MTNRNTQGPSNESYITATSCLSATIFCPVRQLDRTRRADEPMAWSY